MFVRTIVAAASVLALVACAGTEPSSDAASDESAVVASGACGPAAYAAANAEYKKAVATAKQHKIDACAEDTSDLMVIAQQAAAATKACASFSNVIKTSPWAAPIREEMKGNLVLAQLTGDLQVRDAKGEVVFGGLKEVLEGGITLWGPAPGAYGNKSKLEFGAGKSVKIYTQLMDDDGKVSWKIENATYEIDGIHSGAAHISIDNAGKALKFELRPSTTLETIPDFELKLTNPDANSDDRYTAFVSECEA